MLRTVKPRNARSKRALEARDPKVREGAKACIFIRGEKTSQRVNKALSELSQLKKPYSVNFTKKNPNLHPFDDQSSLEFWSEKNDASLMLVGLHSKKRPHDLVWVRTFGGKVLDMMEVGVEELKGMDEFKGPKPSLSTRPLLHFSGPLFSSHPLYIQFKSLLLDFFKAQEATQIDLRGLDEVISFTTGPENEVLSADSLVSTEAGTSTTTTTSTKPTPIVDLPIEPSSSTSTTASTSLPLIHMRTYTLSFLSSGQRTPLVSLSPCGPFMTFRLRRSEPASPELLSQAMRRPPKPKEGGKDLKGRKRGRNIEMDEMGDKIGRIHVGRQVEQLEKMQSRKMKGLKEPRENKKKKREEGRNPDDSDGDAGGAGGGGGRAAGGDDFGMEAEGDGIVELGGEGEEGSARVKRRKA